MFTFKTVKSTGRYRAFYLPRHIIKIKKVDVGSIEPETFRIRLMVIKDDINEDGNPNCEWKWILLKYVPSSLDDAKEFLNKNFEALNKKYNIVKK